MVTSLPGHHAPKPVSMKTVGRRMAFYRWLREIGRLHDGNPLDATSQPGAALPRAA